MKFERMISKALSVGFDECYQAGSTSKYHELNLVCRSKILNRQYWICKSFGKLELIYREGIDNIHAKQHRREYKTQSDLMKILDSIKSEIENRSLELA